MGPSSRSCLDYSHLQSWIIWPHLSFTDTAADKVRGKRIPGEAEIGIGRLWDDLLLRFTQLPPSPSVNFLILSSLPLSLFLSPIPHSFAFLHGPCTESHFHSQPLSFYSYLVNSIREVRKNRRNWKQKNLPKCYSEKEKRELVEEFCLVEGQHTNAMTKRPPVVPLKSEKKNEVRRESL